MSTLKELKPATVLNFKINGSEKNFLTKKTLTLDKFLTYLESLSDGELLTIGELVDQKQVCGRNTLYAGIKYKKIDPKYFESLPAGFVTRGYVFGNPRTIAALRVKLGRQS